MGSSSIFWGGGHKKTIYRGNYLKRGPWTICREHGTKLGGWCFWVGGGGTGGGDTPMHTMTWFSYMPEREVWLADESKLNFDQSFPQLNAKKKINGRSCSRFEFKYWILNTANLNSYLIYANFTLIAFLSWDNFFKDVKSILWGIRTFLTSTWVKLNVKDLKWTLNLPIS